MCEDFTLTPSEEKAIKDLKKALQVLSKRHWFFAADGKLNLMRIKDGSRVLTPSGGMDSEYVVKSIGGKYIDIDGGGF